MIYRYLWGFSTHQLYEIKENLSLYDHLYTNKSKYVWILSLRINLCLFEIQLFYVFLITLPLSRTKRAGYLRFNTFCYNLYILFQTAIWNINGDHWVWSLRFNQSPHWSFAPSWFLSIGSYGRLITAFKFLPISTSVIYSIVTTILWHYITPGSRDFQLFDSYLY